MKRSSLYSLLGLLAAAAVFCGALVYASLHVEKVEARETAFFDDNFTQEPEPGIAELLRDSPWAAGSGAAGSDLESSPSSLPASSEAASSAASGAPSSSVPASDSSSAHSSAPPSSTPVSSAVTSDTASSSSVASDSVSSEEETASDESASDESVSDKSASDKSASDEPFYDNYELLDMVAGAVQREIIGINTPPSSRYYEAYKAQAVASHSYMEYHRRRTGSYPKMSYATPKPQTLELVAEVLDKLVYYQGAPINASYHAASGGHTQSAVYVWGNPVPYLAGVESRYDDYPSSCRISVSSMEDKLLAYGISPSGDPSDWFDLANATYTDGGFINTIDICGITVTGRMLRENILGTSNLKSPKIIGIDCDGSTFTFQTMGFGHGAGLSQNGALGYAENDGWDYQQILTHYYPGTTVR